MFDTTERITLRAAVAIVVASIVAVLTVTTAGAAAATPTCDGLPATIVGTDGDDVLHGTAGVDVIVALAGADRIYGHDGNDVICAGPGPDKVWAGLGHDSVWGNGGNDRIKGDLGKDELYGGNGNDVLAGQAGADRMFGQGGADVLFGETDTDYCDSPGDTLIDCELPIVSPPTGVEAYEAEMFTLINYERSLRSLPALSRHPDLDDYAAAWAVEMSTFPLPLNAANHHSPPFTGSSHPFQDIPDSVAWTAAFENVGYSTVGTSETPADVINRLFYTPGGNGFMSSAGHKCNVLETAASQVGLGAYVDSNGDAWVVQVFWGTEWPLPAAVPECSSVVSR